MGSPYYAPTSSVVLVQEAKSSVIVNPCSNTSDPRSFDPCCGMESWDLVAVPIPSEARNGVDFCTRTFEKLNHNYVLFPFLVFYIVGYSVTNTC